MSFVAVAVSAASLAAIPARSRVYNLWFSTCGYCGRQPDHKQTSAQCISCGAALPKQEASADCFSMDPGSVQSIPFGDDYRKPADEKKSSPSYTPSDSPPSSTYEPSSASSGSDMLDMGNPTSILSPLNPGSPLSVFNTPSTFE